MFLFHLSLSINSYFQDLVSKMSQEEKDKLIEQVIQAEPQLLLDILCEVPSSQSHQPASSKAPSWCKCNHCREMSRDIDKVCCGLKPENCLSEAAEFAISPWVNSKAPHWILFPCEEIYRLVGDKFPTMHQK